MTGTQLHMNPIAERRTYMFLLGFGKISIITGCLGVLSIIIGFFSSVFPIFSPLLLLAILPIAIFLGAGLIFRRIKVLIQGLKGRVFAGLCVFTILFTIFMNYLSFTFMIVWCGDYLHYKLNRQFYMQIIEEKYADKPVFYRFDWGGFGVNPIELTYDDSGYLDKNFDKSLNPLPDRFGSNSEYAKCKYGASHLEGHFYVVRFSC